MENKLQQLTQKLYDEGLEKGRAEAERLVSEAKSEAAKIIADAKAEAEAIVKAAEAKAEDTAKNSMTEIALAGKQAVARIKEEISSLIAAESTFSAVKAANLDPEFVKAMLLSVARNWNGASSSKVELQALLPEAERAKFDAAFAAAAKELLEAGIDRLSIGVQSFDDGCLKLMNRRHTADAARKAVRQAQEAGFGNVTVDLIFGVPGFGAATLARNLRETVALGVQHVSAYHLTVEPQTAFGRRMAQGRFSPVTEETSEEEFLTVHRTLRDAGFEHYEVSNYALPGRRAIHNSAYWSGDPYLGIGPAAHSFDGECRRWAVADIGRYLAGGDRYESERLTERDRYNETVMTALRTAEGLDTKAIGRRFGPARLETLLDAARPWLDAGDATLRDGQLAIPAERFLLSDAVIAALFWEC